MDFLIADTFTDSLARLTADEQKAVKTTAFDLQIDPARPGQSFHKLDRARDKNFWSVRVNRDVRLIVHRTGRSLLLCYVDHHDPAYAWAERRRLEAHPRTGAAQIVEVRETVREVVIPVYVPEERPQEPGVPLLADRSEEELLEFGVPEDWLDDVRQADEDTLLVLAERLPAEAAEALLELATGGTPRTPLADPDGDPFRHPDAQRRFRVLTDVDELERALAYPWDRWTIFLHPEQREWVQRDFTGPARVSGSAGTGKTIVALHRAVHLARAQPDARVLLATFSETLAFALRVRLRRLVGNEPRVAERIDVRALDALALHLHRLRVGPVTLAECAEVTELLQQARVGTDAERFSLRFLRSEWDDVVDAWQVSDREAYLDLSRTGRRTRLGRLQRESLWPVFERVRRELSERGRSTNAAVFSALTDHLLQGGRPTFDFIVVDEAQDISVPQLRFFSALGGGRPNALFFAGDLGQRIFQAPFSWRSLGVDVRGRARTLRVNYRTSHQIRAQADRLLGPEVVDGDGEAERRTDTVSVFNGPPPDISLEASEEAERDRVAAWLQERNAEGVSPEAMGVFVRCGAEIRRATGAVEAAGFSASVLDGRSEAPAGCVSVGTMHLAKGLEFGAVSVMACDDEVLPLQERIEAIGDEADLQDVYDTERHLLYVACTRARDHLLVTGVEPGSEFLEDLGS